MMKSKPSQPDSGKKARYALILREIEKFHYPEAEQRLSLIMKRLNLTKQQLNYYLKRFLKFGLIRKVQDYPYAVYELTGKGSVVKENLVQSEKGVKTVTWRYHNLIMGYKIFTWGSWRFNPRKKVPMNNWSYQIAKADNGLQAHIQDTGLLKIYGPQLYGSDGEELRIKASAMVQDAARFFINKYNFELEEPKILRKGEKELLNSQQLAKLLGRVKTDEIYVNASAGDENLEEPEDKFVIENVLHSLEETPMRLDSLEKKVAHLDAVEQHTRELKSMLQGYLQQQVAVSNAVNYVGAAMKQQTELLEKISERQDRLAVPARERPGERKTGLEAYISAQEATPLYIEFTQKCPKFRHEFRGGWRVMGPFFPGARVYLPGDVARQIILDGYAKEVREDKARTG